MAAGQLTKHRWLRASSLSTAERSYPTSEVRGSSLECQAVIQVYFYAPTSNTEKTEVDGFMKTYKIF